MSIYLANNIGDTMLADSMVLAYAYALEGGRGTQQSFIQEGSAPRYPYLFTYHFFIKGTPFVYFSLKN